VSSAAAGLPDALLKLAGPGHRTRWLQAALAAALAVRLVTLGTYPLADTSEARYAEIVRVMRETGNWVTLQETPGTPFLGKPPLYAWLSAASTYAFGLNEFSLRLPSFVCGIAVLALCGVWAAALARRPSPSPPAPLRPPSKPILPLFGSEADNGGRRQSPSELVVTEWGEGHAALLSCVVLATTGFFIGYGAVMTDPALGLCTAWMMVAFQRAVIDGSGHALWRYGFFVAAGLAMLAKGPVAFLYVALPIVVWAFWRGRWRAIWKALPWLRGSVLSAAISLPWYVWAEVRNPDFLSYFLIGEHVLRYLQPGWTGDRYGTAHREPFGTIWGYLAEALGLWSIALLALVRPTPGWLARARAWCQDDGRLFALLATLVPLLVLTFASNVIWTYVMPVLTPLAALLGLELAQRSARPEPSRRLVNWLAGASVALVCTGAAAWGPLHANGSSFAAPVMAWRQQLSAQPGPLLYWGAKTPASLRFYSRGAAEPVPDLATRLDGLEAGSRVYVAIVPEQLAALRQMVLIRPQPFDLAVVVRVKHAAIVRIARTLSAS
jgi:4-amino-4-deoxy-L-arabinose transferase-like glycosyltransferase